MPSATHRRHRRHIQRSTSPCALPLRSLLDAEAEKERERERRRRRRRRRRRGGGARKDRMAGHQPDTRGTSATAERRGEKKSVRYGALVNELILIILTNCRTGTDSCHSVSSAPSEVSATVAPPTFTPPPLAVATSSYPQAMASATSAQGSSRRRAQIRRRRDDGLPSATDRSRCVVHNRVQRLCSPPGQGLPKKWAEQSVAIDLVREGAAGKTAPGRSQPDRCRAPAPLVAAASDRVGWKAASGPRTALGLLPPPRPRS